MRARSARWRDPLPPPGDMQGGEHRVRGVRRETATPEETEAAGAELARKLEPGDLVLVAGELGSGKTTFVRGAAKALGVTDPVTSPTFTIGQVYGGGDIEMAHIDLYRLHSLSGEDPAL